MRVGRAQQLPIDITAMASAIARRLGGHRRTPQPPRVDAIASAVIRRINTKRRGQQRLPIAALASAIAQRLGAAPRQRASPIDALASAVAKRLSAFKEGQSLDTHVETAPQQQTGQQPQAPEAAGQERSSESTPEEQSRVSKRKGSF